MELSLFLAQLFGITYIIIGLVVIVKADYYRDMYEKFMKDQVFVWTAGMTGVVVGTALVLSHNIWEMDWRLLITVLGWGGLIKGIMLLLCPERSTRPFGKSFQKKNYLIFGGLFWLFYGLILGYFGFIA